jgi:hypothetical protein
MMMMMMMMMRASLSKRKADRERIDLTPAHADPAGDI